MIKKFYNYVLEKDELEDITSDENDFTNIKDAIKELIEQTIESSGGNFNTFVSSYKKNPDEYSIEGLINDSDIYDFYLKYRNDIDEMLNNIKFFDEIPSDMNVYGLYDYIIQGTNRCVDELMKDIN